MLHQGKYYDPPHISLFWNCYLFSTLILLASLMLGKKCVTIFIINYLHYIHLGHIKLIKIIQFIFTQRPSTIWYPGLAEHQDEYIFCRTEQTPSVIFNYEGQGWNFEHTLPARIPFPLIRLSRAPWKIRIQVPSYLIQLVLHCIETQ
jgi:hypothetical protein